MSEIKGSIYILSNRGFPNLSKVGYSDDAVRRVEQINRSSTIPYLYKLYASYDVVERLTDLIFHELLLIINPGLRISDDMDSGRFRNTEFFDISPEKVFKVFKSIAIMTGTKDRLKRYDEEGNEIDVIWGDEVLEETQRRGPFTFSSVNINSGEIITFVPDSSITATVVDDKHIQLGDTVTSLSGAAKSILHKNALQGPKYWTYKGKVLDDIRTEKENGGC